MVYLIQNTMKKQVIKWVRENLGLFPAIISVVVLHYLIGGIRSLPNIALVGVYLISIITYITHSRFSISPVWFCFLIYLPFTILLANPDSVFHPWDRLMLFGLLYLSFAPVIQSPYARLFRKRCLNFSLLICIVVSIGSFICYFLGINLFSYELASDYVGKAGMFSGLTKQSMYLGPISGISVIYLFYLTIFKRQYWSWFLIIPCAGCLLFASSRIAFAATIGGLLVELYYMSENKSKAIKRLIVIGIFICLTFPLWESATFALQEKASANENLINSRANKFLARVTEFTSSPVYGVGFASIDANGLDSFNHKTGTIEPGSSWLGILSMTGIIGMIYFCTLYFHTILSIIRIKQYAWLLAILFFFGIHMLAEGYVFAAGSPTAFLLWMSLGCAFDKKFE